MASFKIRRLIGIVTFSAAIIMLRIYFLPTPVEPPPVQTPVQTAPVSDSRFENTEFDKNLQAQADALLPLFDRMPSVPVFLKDEPILKSGTNTETSNSYTNCDGNQFPFIFVKKIYFQTAHRTRLENTLKHEMTHAWLCRRQLMSTGHGEIFRRKLKEIGGWLNTE